MPGGVFWHRLTLFLPQVLLASMPLLEYEGELRDPQKVNISRLLVPEIKRSEIPEEELCNFPVDCSFFLRSFPPCMATIEAYWRDLRRLLQAVSFFSCVAIPSLSGCNAGWCSG